jgi:biopolymer transport protein ExbD
MSSGPTIIVGRDTGTIIGGAYGGPPLPPAPPRMVQPVDEEESPLNRFQKPKESMEFALPTINVIFLLMLYFLIAGTIVQNDELSVLPPVTTETPTDRLPRPLLVVHDDGRLQLDGQLVANADLMTAAADAVTRSSTQQLNVLAPAEMASTPFLELINAFAASNIPVRVVMIEKSALMTPSRRAAEAAEAAAE